MKKVLLTGASGFVGRQTISFLLERGFEVHAVTRQDYIEKRWSINCQWHKTNLLDTNCIDKLVNTVKPKYLLHFAWDVIPGYLNSNENFKWLQASLELLQAFYQYDGQRVVIAGTCFEYDLRQGYCTEGVTLLSPNSIYGLCKHSLNILLQSFSKKNNLSSAWGRIFYLYGPGEEKSRLVSSVICSLLQSNPALCSHGNQIRDYLYVRDVAHAFAALLDSEITGEINICSGIPVTLKEIIEIISKEIDKSELVKLGAIIASTEEPLLIVGNPSRLENQLNWSPKWSLRDGLLQTIDWWKEEFKM